MQLGVPRDVRLTSAKETFLLDCKAAGLSPKTLRAYRDTLNNFITFTGDLLVRELVPDHVRTYIAELSEHAGRYRENDNKMSSHSLAKHYAVIRTWIRWLYAQKIITERITDFVKPPRLSKRLPSIMTDEEVTALLEDVKSSGRFRDLVIFELFLDTGLRLDEVAGLQLSDVNIEGGWVKVIGKGDREDIVPIGARVCRDLFAYINMYRKPVHESERALFLNRFNYPLEYEALAKLIRREMAKVRGEKPKRGAHVMRHTAGTNMIRGGASQEHVRRILRHTDGRITQAYLHLADEDLLDAHRAASPVDRQVRKGHRR